MEKLVIEFQNGNEWVEDSIGQSLGGPVTAGGLAAHPPHRTRKGGPPLFYM